MPVCDGEEERKIKADDLHAIGIGLLLSIGLRRPVGKNYFGSARIQGDRLTQEDEMLIVRLPTADAFCVFDGHNGDREGKRLLSGVGNALRTAFSDPAAEREDVMASLFDRYSHEARLRRAFTLLDEGNTDPKSGSTAVICIVDDTAVSLAHCGDSRGVVFDRDEDGNPVVVLATQDHKPTRCDEAARVRSAGGVIVNTIFDPTPRVGGQVAMSRCFGDRAIVGITSTPEIIFVRRPIHHARLRFFAVIASDGLWDEMTNEEVGKAVINFMDTCELTFFDAPQGAARHLIKIVRGRCTERGVPCDNVSVIVIDISPL